MNELLIKLKSLLTGSGFQEAEQQLRKVKAAADDANKSVAKVGSTPAGGTKPAGKMFTSEQSKSIASEWTKQWKAEAEAARKSLADLEGQATQTKAVMESGGGGGGGGGFLTGAIRAGGLAIGAIAVGKIASAQVDKLSEGVKAATANTREMIKSFGDASNAVTLDAAVSQFDQLSSIAASTQANLAKLNSEWGSWTANLLTGGEAFREIQAQADQQRSGAFSALSGSMARQVGLAQNLAVDPLDAGRTSDLQRSTSREDEQRKLQEILASAKTPDEKLSASNAMASLQEKYAAEDVALAKIEAAKQEQLQIELQISQAKQAGNLLEQQRLEWVKEYTAALRQAQAAGMADPYGFAKDSANARLPDAANTYEDTKAAVEAARQEGLDRQAADAERSRQAAEAAQAQSEQDQIAKDLARAKADAGRNEGLYDAEQRAGMAATDSPTEQRRLEWLRTYKSELSSLTDGLEPGTAEWAQAADYAAKIADAMDSSVSNQAKLAASASAESSDSTAGLNGRIQSRLQRDLARADRYEEMGAFSTAEKIRKKAFSTAERQAGDALKEKGLDGVAGRDLAKAEINQMVAAIPTAEMTAAASALNTSASALTAAATALSNVGRYQ
jgi:hypothetical protein